MSQSESGMRERTVQLAIRVWTVVGSLLLLWAAAWLLARLAPVLTPIALALVIVFVLKGPVNRMQDVGVPRVLAVVLAYLGALVVLAVIVLVVGPALARRIGEFIQAFPTYYERAYAFFLGLVEQYRALSVPDWLTQMMDEAQSQVMTSLSGLSRRAASGLFTAGGQAVGFIFNSFMALVIAFYLLKDLPRIREGAFRLVPEPRRAEARRLYCDVVNAIGGYIRGQLIVAAFVGVLAWLVLWIIGVPYPAVIGLITGVFNVVPYLGAIIGAAVAAIAAAFVSPWLAVVAVLALVAVQQVEGLFISPRVMSKQVNLHPVAVIIALLVGGTLMGFVGLLIAIPVTAAGKGILVYYLEKHGLWEPEARPIRRLWRARRKTEGDSGKSEVDGQEE
ncbi:MAG: AI-2E family transporter [Coriobacteriia bacterium]